jgi:ATP-binding cassette subfamily C protein
MLESYLEFFKYFGKGYKRYIPFVIAGAAVAGVFEIAGLLLLLPFIHILVHPESISKYHFLYNLMRSCNVTTVLQQAFFVGVSIVVIFVFKNVFLLFYYFWQNSFLRKWKIDISMLLMRFYLLSPYNLHLLKTSDKIIRNVNNVVLSSLNNFIFQGFMLISNAVVGLIIFALLIKNYFFFTIITALVLLISSIGQYLFLKRKISVLGEEKNRLISEQHKNIFQGLYAIKETKVLGCEQFFLDSFNKVNRSAMENDMWTMFYRQLPPRATEISAILCVVIMCFGVIHSNFGDKPAMIASLGILAAILFRTSTIVNRILHSLQHINNSQDSITILLDEIKSPMWGEYLEADRNRSAKSECQMISFSSEIVIKNLSYIYPKAKRLTLENINVRIKKGEFVGIVGKSGAGKTTFVDILLGLLSPTEGQICIDGVPLTRENIYGWQKLLGYVPQQVYITNDTAIRNVAFGVDDDLINLSRVKRSLEDAHLYAEMKDLPEGLETPLGENGRRLSGGQKQRIGIARALYKGTDVIVLDEATSSLDISTEGEITKAINHLKGDRTIIAIAHRLSTLKKCDRILYFHDQNLIDSGSFTSLSKKYKDFDRMVQLSKI